MNPAKFAQMMKYLTRVKKQKPDLPDVFPASKAPIPPKTQNVEEIEAINAFIRRERQQKAGGGMLVQPGFGGTRQGYKQDKLTIQPPKTLTGMAGDRKLTADQIASLNPDFKGNLIDKKTKKVIGKIYTKELNDAFEVLNVIKKNKGYAASIEEIGRLAGFFQPAGGKTAGKVNFKRTNLAFKLAVDQFDELENFKLASEKYPKIDKKKFRYLDTIAKSFANHNITTNPIEAAAHLLPDNMAMIYDLGGREDVTKDIFNVRGKLNANDKKFLIDRISVLTGKNFNTEKLNNLIEKTTKVRTAEGRIATRIKLNANMNKQIKDIADDSTIKNLLTKPLNRKTQTALLTRATEIVGGDASIASRRLFQMAEAMSDTTNMYKNLGIKINNNIANKIIATGKQIGGRNNRYGMSSALYTYYGNVVDKALGATEGETFIGRYQQAIRNALDKGQSPDEIFSLTASARRGLSPYAIFTQQLRTDVNSAIKGAYIDSALSRTHEKLQKIFQGRKYNQLNAEDKKAADALVETFEKEKIRALNQPVNPGAVREGAKPIYLTASEKKNIQLPSFDLKNPPSKSIANYKDFDKNLQNAFNRSYEAVGYSMKVPKEFLTQKQLLGQLRPGQAGFATIDALLAPYKAVGKGFVKVGGPFEAGFFGLDYMNEKSKGLPADTAAQIALNNITFGLLGDPDKFRMRDLVEAGNKLGVTNTGAFQQFKNLIDLEKQIIEQRTSVNDFMAYNEAVGGKDKLTPKLDVFSQTSKLNKLEGEYARALNQFNALENPEQIAEDYFNSVQFLGRQEYNKAIDTKKNQVYPNMGTMGSDFMTTILNPIQSFLPQNLMESGLGPINIATRPVVRNLRKIPFIGSIFDPTSDAAKLSAMSEEEKNQRALDMNIIPQNVQPGIGQTMTEEQLAPYYEQFFAGGGIAKLAGDRSGPPPERGPMSQGLQGLMKRVRNL